MFSPSGPMLAGPRGAAGGAGSDMVVGGEETVVQLSKRVGLILSVSLGVDEACRV
jgi:hypothetical protein